MLGSLIFIIGTAFPSMDTSIGWLVTGRIICGSVQEFPRILHYLHYLHYIYISEISLPYRRGALVSLNQLAITIGIFFPM